MTAQQVIEGFYQAWTTGNLKKARTFLADNLTFQGSLETYDNVDDFMAALARFQGMLKEALMIKSFFGDEGGSLLYDCDTKTPIGIMRTAEFFTVIEGKITEIRLVFDATEFHKVAGSS
jgi:hypothetical protein